MKFNEFNFTDKDIITTDGYLDFCLSNNICYVKTDFFYLNQQFNWRGEVHPKFLNKNIVIGHSDYPIVDEISLRFDKVLCINKVSKNKNTLGMPLGICNDTDESELHRIFGNKNCLIETKDKNIEKKNIVYLNFNIGNFTSERKLVFDLFNNKDFVLKTEIEHSFEGRKKYLEEIKSSKFVLCPRGNGIDTHRIWETLYMGSIPIVKYEDAHELFTDLPILFIKEWSFLNKNFLEDKYTEIINSDWNLDKLKQSYWNNFIINNM